MGIGKVEELREIVSLATQICRNEGVKADPLELAYIATLVQQHHPHDAPHLHAEQLAAATAEGVLRPADAGWQATIKLQIAMERAYQQQQQQATDLQAGRQQRMTSAANSVLRLRASPAGSIEEYEAAAQKLLDYLAAAGAQLGEGPDARAEMAAALESVCGLTGVARLLTLAPAARQQQIEALVPLVTGVGLFNSSRGGSAASMYLVGASAALQQGHALLRRLQQAASECRQAHAWLTRLSGEVATPGPGSLTLRRSLTSKGAGGGGLPCGGAVLHCCQVWSYLVAMAGDLDGGLQAAGQLQAQMQQMLVQVQQLVGSSSAVPKDAAFPLLEQLGATHAALKDELQLLLQRQRLWEMLAASVTATAGAAAAAAAGVVCPLGFMPPPGMGSRIAAACRPEGPPSQALISSLPNGLQHIPHLPGAAATPAAPGELQEGWEQQAQLQVALGGLCAVSLAQFAAAAGQTEAVVGGGVVAHELLQELKLADPSLGGIRIGDAVYGFASSSELSAFLSDPQPYLDALQQALEAQPLLRQLLHLSSGMAPSTPQQSAEQQQSSSPGAAAAASGGGAGAEGSYSVEGAADAGSSELASSSADGNTAGVAGGEASQASSSDSQIEGEAEQQGDGQQQQHEGGPPSLRELLLGLHSLLLKVDAGTQTPTHFIEKHLDYSYSWNEWALRRRLLALTNLTHKATHGSQTDLSHFRREGATQVWLPKPAVTQTPVNKASSMPRPLRYVTGLRGAPDVKMKVVTLQLDLGQPHKV